MLTIIELGGGSATHVSQPLLCDQKKRQEHLMLCLGDWVHPLSEAPQSGQTNTLHTFFIYPFLFYIENFMHA